MPEFNPNYLHAWDLTPKAAIALQKELAPKVVRSALKRPDEISTVAGIDTGYRNDMAHAAVVVMNLKRLEIIETVIAAKPLTFPYIPGLLSFREGPAVLKALGKLKSNPDLLMFDGQGIAHPRRLGIASHIGVLTGIPSIGCAKTKLSGDYDEPELERGSISYLRYGEETIGAVVRTRSGVKPVFVSVGHLMNLEDSIQITLKSCRGYRLPEPIRRADQLPRKHS